MGRVCGQMNIKKRLLKRLVLPFAIYGQLILSYYFKIMKFTA